ncbi:MAG: hypothetical protein ETSY2_47555 [Candidatus Entotheonella gemina]|uniref:Uncharacterized protein n=1 Tax=Candidatus Entotheonella gemina TaxID=1429439 RepID=W4LEQ6_9BACT|nr:MAG: hypothetical protein ETSY2_47555 [Candidatus Entotheonella gemina]
MDRYTVIDMMQIVNMQYLTILKRIFILLDKNYSYLYTPY